MKPLIRYFTGDIFVDNGIMAEILSECTLYTGTDRKNYYKKHKDKYPTSKQISATWGYTRRGKMSETKWREESEYDGYYETKVMSDNPELEKIFKEYASYHLPKKFFWSQVQINFNYDIPKHFDSSNQGYSYIVGIGDYTGGELMIDFNGYVKTVDIKDSPYTFNGSDYEHWVAPFEGDRWSLVFFTHHTKEQLHNLKIKKLSKEYEDINEVSRLVEKVKV
jgi:hypothetical protein